MGAQTVTMTKSCLSASRFTVGADCALRPPHSSDPLAPLPVPGEVGEQPQRSSDMSCSDQLNIFVCVWDQRQLAAHPQQSSTCWVCGDLVYLVREAFVGGSNHEICLQ